VLLETLTGVRSARIVGLPSGQINDVHVLTGTEVPVEQTVRNVESALLGHFNVYLDPRKVTVVQQSGAPPEAPKPTAPSPFPRVRGIAEQERAWDDPRSALVDSAPAQPLSVAPSERRPPPASAPEAPAPDPAPLPDPTYAIELDPAPPMEERVVFLGHAVESVRSGRLRMRVALEWRGQRCVGETHGAGLARSRLEGFATATLRAMEAALESSVDDPRQDTPTLSLDGVEIVEAFDREFVLVAVRATVRHKVTALTGAAAIEDSRDRAVILATLQAIDRRARAFVEDADPEGGDDRDTGDSYDDEVFQIWA